MPGPGQNPSVANIWESARECTDYVQEREQHGNANTPNVYGLYNDAVADTGGRDMIAAIGVLNADRRTGAGRILQRDQLQAIYGPHMTEWLRARSLPRTGSYEKRLFDMVEELIATAQTFNSRGMTLATPTFPSGTVGTGVIRRCTVDRFGSTLECTGAEAKQARCRFDQTNSAKKHREVFRFRGATPATDRLQFLGSGLFGDYEAADCNGGILRNPSFEQGAGSTDGAVPAATTTIAGWVLTTAANWHIRVETEQTSPHVLVYRGYDGSPIGTGYLAALECIASDSLTQNILRQNPGQRFDEDVPYYMAVAWRRLASATGTLSITVGSLAATSVDISTGTNGVWNVLLVPLGQNSWYRQFGSGDQLAVTITVATLAVGTVEIDDVMLKQMINIDGTYYLPVGGATPWLQDDQATWTDVDGGTRARFSYWFWQSLLAVEGDGEPQGAAYQRCRGVWLPTNNAGAETIVD